MNQNMNQNTKFDQLLIDNNPIEIVVKMFVQIAHMFNVESGNSYTEIKERVVNYMFLKHVNALPPEEQIATLEYVTENGNDKRELIVLSSPAMIPTYLKSVALETKVFILGEGVDHYLAYQTVFQYAVDFQNSYESLA